MSNVELRLRNWLQLGERYCYVSSLFISHFRAVDKDGIDLGNSLQVNYQPIPLTPEILEKAGFENDGGEYMHPANTDFDLMFCQSPNGLWCAYNFGHSNYGPFEEHGAKPPTALPICNPFKYVHQLQSLYFALTGQELEIKL